MQLHIHGFEALRLDVVVDDAFCRAVVCLQRCARLRVAHFEEDFADICCLARVDVERAEFALGGARHDCFDYLGDVENRTVIGGVFCFF